MNDINRIDQLGAEMDALIASSAGPGRERSLLVAGVVLMATGIAITLVTYLAAGNQDSGDLSVDNLEHNELLILAVGGVATSIVGGFVFLRYSLGRLLRLWLLRQVHESRRLAQRLEQGGG
ncbi:MAG TPA: hypothetical protein VGA13_01920 [Acidimicrobiales bacterium]